MGPAGPFRPSGKIVREIRFSCPHCGVGVSISDRFAGGPGQCPACGRVVAIPPIAPRGSADRGDRVRHSHGRGGMWSWRFWKPFVIPAGTITGVCVVLVLGVRLLIARLGPAPTTGPSDRAAVEALLRAERTKSDARPAGDGTPAEKEIPEIDPKYNVQIQRRLAELAEAYRRRGMAYEAQGAQEKADADYAKAAELMKQSRE